PLFEGLSEENAQDVDVLSGLANCHFLKGELDEAISGFQMIDSNAFRAPHLAINYALALKFKGRDADAQRIFQSIERKKLGSLTRYYKKVADFLGVRL
ncbi:MAG: hypothetical protein WCG27_08710, partial [Pseudomonadota bacterium]